VRNGWTAEGLVSLRVKGMEGTKRELVCEDGYVDFPATF